MDRSVLRCVTKSVGALVIAVALMLTFATGAVALSPTGRVAGSVTDAKTGGPASGVEVTAWFHSSDGFWSWGTGTETDTDGWYSIDNLSPGEYQLSFIDNSGYYAPQFYDGATTIANAADLVVAPGAEMWVSAAVEPGGHVSGRITDKSTGEPISGEVWVSASAPRGADRISLWGAGVVADASGHYDIGGLPPGDVCVNAYPLSHAYAERWYGDTADPIDAARVKVDPTSPVNGIDIGLVGASHITGRVTDSVTGEPVANAGIGMGTHDWGDFAAMTDASGYYRIDGLSAGSYWVDFGDVSGYRGRYARQFYDGQASLVSANWIDVSDESTITDIDFALEPASHVLGRVTDWRGNPLRGIIARCVPSTGDEWYTARTDASGYYSVGRLPAGTYKVAFGDASGYVAEQFYGGTTLASAGDVVLGVAETKSGIDHAMALPRSISGRVLDTSGQPVKWREVFAWFDDGGIWQRVSGAEVDSSGYYMISGLDAGTYHVGFSETSGYSRAYYGGSSTLSGAADIELGPGGGASGVDITRTRVGYFSDRSGRLSGRVTDKVTGEPVGGVSVMANKRTRWGWDWFEWAVTDASGVYRFSGLSTGDYRLQFYDGSERYGTQYLGGDTIENATTVTLTDWTGVRGVDMLLAPAARLSGRVIDRATGAPVSGAIVSVMSSRGDGCGLSTDASGAYSIGGLLAGDYYVSCVDESGYYAPSYLGGGSVSRNSSPLTLTEGVNVPDIDFSLVRGSHITGQVTDKATGQSAPGRITVAAYVKDGVDYGTSFPRFEQIRRTMADASGYYDLAGLPADTVYVAFYPESSGRAARYYSAAGQIEDATGIAVSEESTVTGVDAELVGFSHITGRVTDKVTGEPVPYAEIGIAGPNGDGGLAAFADSSGYYDIEWLAAGTYRVCFYDASGYNRSRYVQQWFGGASSFGSAAGVSVSDETTVTGVDFAVTPAAHISGHVTDWRGHPMSGVTARCLLADGQIGGSAVSDASGYYSVGRLSAGSYKISFEDHSGYYPEQFFGSAVSAHAIQLTVAEGESRDGIDKSMARRGTISGRVLDTSGLPVAWRSISAWIDEGGVWERIVGAEVDASGYYMMSGLSSGTYRVGFSETSGYSRAFYGGSSTLGGATAVELAENTGAGGIDVTRARVGYIPDRRGRISGRVTDKVTGEPVEGIWVVANKRSRWGWDWAESAQTDASGVYRFTDMPGGTYRLEFSDGSGQYSRLYFGGDTLETAADVPMTGWRGVRDIDVALSRAARVRGRVMDQLTGEPVAGALVMAHSKEGWGEGLGTDESGYYEIGGLSPGDYYVSCIDESGRYSLQYSDGTFDREHAAALGLAEGEDASGTDFSLCAGSHITGQVTDRATGQPIQGRVTVSAFVRSGTYSGTSWPRFDQISSVSVDASGYYDIGGLPFEGTVYLGFYADASGYVDRYYGGTGQVEKSKGIPVSEASTVAGIDVGLVGPSHITGRVIDSVTGEPVANAWIDMGSLDGAGYAAITDASGCYNINHVSAGSYWVGFYDASGYDEGRYVRQYSGGSATFDSAQWIEVSDESTTTGVDFSLVTGSRLSGRIADWHGNPLAGVTARAVPLAGEGWFAANTDASGYYSIGRLPAGSYKVAFEDTSGYYPDQFHGGTTLADADEIVLGRSETKTGVDHVMTLPGTISGRVLDSAGEPVAWRSIFAWFDDGGSWQRVRGAEVDSSGYYMFADLDAGAYRVGFCETSGYSRAYYAGSSTLGGAADVELAVGAGAAGIDITRTLTGFITGRVTDTETGQPIAGVLAAAYRDEGGNDWEWVDAYGVTNSEGYYAIPAGAGSYRVGFWDVSGYHLTRYYGGSTTMRAAANVIVAQGAGAAGIDAVLPPQPYVTGRVIDKITGQPVAGAALVTAGANGDGGFGGLTDILGTYRTSLGAEGTFVGVTGDVSGYAPGRYAAQWYDGAAFLRDAKALRAPEGGGVHGVDFVLAPASHISGRVTDKVTGEPLPGIDVSCIAPDGYGRWLSRAVTDAQGCYDLGALASESYKIVFEDASGYFQSLYNGGIRTLAESQSIAVGEGVTVSGVDVSMYMAEADAPVTTDDAPSGWQHTDVEVALTRDDTGSGVYATYYRVNGSSPATYTDPLRLTTEGVNHLEYWSVDNAGNAETTKAATIRIDKTAPVTTDNAPRLPQRNNVSVMLTPADLVSGPATTYYRLNAGVTTTYTAPIAVTADGGNSIAYWSVDRAGNVEATKTVVVIIDKVAPVTTSDAPQGWQRTSVSLRLSASDAFATYYRLNGGAVVTYTVPVAISSDGFHTLEYWSVDAAGNAEAVQTATVRIDKTAPATWHDAPSAWQKGPVAVVLTATDAGSGVAMTYYQIDGRNRAYSRPFEVSVEGFTTFEYWSVDSAGNMSALKEATVLIDRSGPEIVVDEAGTSTDLLTVGANATDALSGLASLEMRIDGGPWASVSRISTDAPGGHTVDVRAVDSAGNESTATRTFGLNPSSPVTSANAARYYADRATIKLSASDDLGGSGVAQTYYRLDGGAQVESSTVVVKVAGTHSITYWSVDRSGNAEAPHTAVFTIIVTPDRNGRPSRPVVPSSVRHGAYFTVYGYLNRHSSGSYPVTIQFFRYQHGHWVLRKSVSGKAANMLTFSKYYRSTYVPYAGKWMVRTRHKVGSTYYYSSKAYLTAK